MQIIIILIVVSVLLSILFTIGLYFAGVFSPEETKSNANTDTDTGVIYVKTADTSKGAAFTETFKTGSLGGRGGRPNSLICPKGAFVTEVYGGAGVLVDRIGVKCSNGSNFGPFGGDGGSEFNVVSNDGFKRIEVKSGVYVDNIKLFDNKNALKKEIGGSGGQGPTSLDCKDGKIMGFEIRNDSILDNIKVVCGI